MKSSSIVPIILCGGSGTRLWPLSRESFPKQYISLNNKNKSLLQQTQERIKKVFNIREPILICNEEHRFIVAEQMREIKVKPYEILLEPFGRNTAPAITISSLVALEKEEDPVILVLSSDHSVENKQSFVNTINSAIEYAEKDRIVTLGVHPLNPETGYGYIKAEKPLNYLSNEGVNILEFIEKPDYNTAKKYLENKCFAWNSGIFIFKAKVILNEIKYFYPDIFKYCKNSLIKSKRDLDFRRIDKNSFSFCPNLSIDLAIMNKTNRGTVLPLNAGWRDVGSWKSVWESSKKDKFGNFKSENIILKKSRNSYLRTDKKLIVGIGLNNLIVVETKDALLISDLNCSQEIKEVVKDLQNKNIPESLKQSKAYRPWGNYESIAQNSNWQVKLIQVKPGQRLSLQMHKFRSEHWIIVNGLAEVEIDNSITFLKPNQSIYIPRGSKHRLSNPEKSTLDLIEVQCGSYLGEDDIIRFEDVYGRQ